MSLQHTTLLGFLAILIVSCASTTTQQSSGSSGGATAADELLPLLGSGIQTLKIEGTLTTTGERAFDGVPFSAELDEEDSFRLTMSGPFGITAAKMVASRDTFRMVNYLLQEVWEGHPLSPRLKGAMHLPIETGALMSLMRGRVPEGNGEFVVAKNRQDGTILYKRDDDNAVEYLLVDPTTKVIKQYQRKSLEGEKLLDVAFSSVRTVQGVELPHQMYIASNNAESTATVKITEAIANDPLVVNFDLKAPSSFSKENFPR